MLWPVYSVSLVHRGFRFGPALQLAGGAFFGGSAELQHGSGAVSSFFGI